MGSGGPRRVLASVWIEVLKDSRLLAADVEPCSGRPGKYTSSRPRDLLEAVSRRPDGATWRAVADVAVKLGALMRSNP